MAHPSYDASDTIYVRARQILADHPEQRLGQAFYNAARGSSLAGDGDQWLRDWIDGTTADPFDNDAALPAFLTLWHRAFGG
jgi:hypothetical protein